MTLDLLYKKSTLRTFLLENETIIKNKNFNLALNHNENFQQIIHCEEAIIALSAVVIEAVSIGEANMKVAYGTKILKFKATNNELLLIKKALTNIYRNASSFNLFEMLDDNTKVEVLDDISQMIKALEDLL